METLQAKTVLVSGGSRGIGLAIAAQCAEEGARVVLLAKTDRPHPRLPGTIHTAAAEIQKRGGEALPLICDIRDPTAVKTSVAAALDRFGGIDILVNNASAISLTPTLETEIRRYDLMHDVNARGTFVVTQACLPSLLESEQGRILTISPPLTFAPRWWSGHPAYTLEKFGMSMLAAAWASEFKDRVASNCLWPRTMIDTAAVRNLLGGEAFARRARKPSIMGDAAVALFKQPMSFTGWFCLDDLVLAAEGRRSFDEYAVDPSVELQLDFFLPDDALTPIEAAGALGWRVPNLPPLGAEYGAHT